MFNFLENAWHSPAPYSGGPPSAPMSPFRPQGLAPSMHHHQQQSAYAGMASQHNHSSNSSMSQLPPAPAASTQFYISPHGNESQQQQQQQYESVNDRMEVRRDTSNSCEHEEDEESEVRVRTRARSSAPTKVATWWRRSLGVILSGLAIACILAIMMNLRQRAQLERLNHQNHYLVGLLHGRMGGSQFAPSGPTGVAGHPNVVAGMFPPAHFGLGS
jgi:hypothetical protein